MTYTPEFLENIYKKLSLIGEEKEKFSSVIINAGNDYLFLKLTNPKIADIRKQKTVLKQYHDALEKVRGLYEQVQNDRIPAYISRYVPQTN